MCSRRQRGSRRYFELHHKSQQQLTKPNEAALEQRFHSCFSGQVHDLLCRITPQFLTLLNGISSFHSNYCFCVVKEKMESIVFSFYQ